MPVDRPRDWTPAGFVLTVVAATILGALFAQWMLDTETIGHPVKRSVHTFEDWLFGLDIVVIGICAFFLLAFCYALNRTRRFTN